MKTLMYLFIAAILVIAGCAKDDTLFENPENINNQDLMLKSGKPDQPGDNLKVFRYEGAAYYVLYDEETDLTTFVGVDIRQLYLGGDLASYDVLNIQEIIKEGDEGESPRSHILVSQDDITVEVWEGLIQYVSQLFSADPVYSGTGHLVYTNNDYLYSDNDDKNTNVWGLRLNGEGINIKYHAMWHGDDPSTIEVSLNIMLK